MRLIDADYLKNLPFERMIHTDFGDTAVSIEEIDNAPTVEITEEQAIDKLHDTGWLPRHDKEMTERPTVTDLTPEQIINIVPHECIEILAKTVTDVVKQIDWKMIIEKMSKRPQGEWIPKKDYDGIAYWKCSECKVLTSTRGNFCPVCGADMRKEAENDHP